MASYSVVTHNSNSYVKAIGTGITSSALHSFIQSNPSVGSSYGFSSGARETYFFNANILIGDSSNSGNLTTWDISSEQITINMPNTFEVHGVITGGSLDPDGYSQNGCSFMVYMPVNDAFLFKDNGEVNLYGSHTYCNGRIKVEGNNAAYRTIDCDREYEDDIDAGTSENFTFDVTRSRVHHTGAVGLKTFSVAPVGLTTNFILDDVKIQKCTYAFQVGWNTNLTIRNTEIDSCTYHIVGFAGWSSIVRFIDSDVPTSLRFLSPPPDGQFSLENSYSLTVKDLDNNSLEDVSIWLVDQQGDVRFQVKTDSNGNPITTVDTLERRTYVGTTETIRENHTIYSRAPNTIWKDQPLLVSGVEVINAFLFAEIDQYYTQTDAVAQAHTGITITDHGVSPVTWNGLEYRFTVTCDLSVNPSLDIEDVYHYLKYHQSQIGTFVSLDTRSVHQFLSVVDGQYRTNTSSLNFYSGIQAGVRIIDQDDNAFIGVDRHYSNNGSYFEGSKEVNLSAPNIIDDTRVVVINYTRSTKIIDQYGAEIITVPVVIDNSVVSGGNGYSFDFIAGGNETTQFGDILLFKLNWQSGTQAKVPLRVFASLTENGVILVDSQEDDEIHNNMVFNGITGLDGSTVDASNGGELSANFTNVEINVNDSDNTFDCRRGIAWWRWINTTAQGALYYDALGLAYLPDEYNIEIRGPLKIKNAKVDSELTIINGIWKHYQGETIIADDSYTIVWVPNDRLYSSNLSQVEQIKQTVDQYLDATVSSRSTLTAQQVWEYGTRTLTNFGTLISDIWSNAVRTITGGAASQTSVDSLSIAVNNIPTNPLLVNDSRLNNLDSPISDLALQSSIDEILVNHKNPTYYYGQDGTTRVKQNDAYFISLRSTDGSTEIRRINVIDENGNPTSISENGGYN